jgi:N-ethylmaleimide reductase
VLIFTSFGMSDVFPHPALHPDNLIPVAPSPIIPAGKAFIENELDEGELVPFVRRRPGAGGDFLLDRAI